MKPPQGVDRVPTPALLFNPQWIETNLAQMLEIADGNPARLRPHMKTHKCGEILRLQRRLGINRVKCATPAEVNLALEAGVDDAMLAFPPVGPALEQLIELRRLYPEAIVSTIVDDPLHLSAIREASARAGTSPLPVFVDLDIGMGRTGIEPGNAALALVRSIQEDSYLNFGGIHAYDGHIHDTDPRERRASFQLAIDALLGFVDALERSGLKPPKIVSGGTPTFPFHADAAAQSKIPWECSPGTPVLWDAGYGSTYPDLPFEPAAAVLARVISRPGANRLCLDLGHKAVSAENPIERRVRFNEPVEAVAFVAQSEEHLLIETPGAGRFRTGDAWLGIPWHICPTVALHDQAWIIRNGRITGERWSIEARRRLYA